MSLLWSSLFPLYLTASPFCFSCFPHHNPESPSTEFFRSSMEAFNNYQGSVPTFSDIWIFEDLKCGSTNKREQISLDFLHLYCVQCGIFQFHPFTYNFHDFSAKTFLNFVQIHSSLTRWVNCFLNSFFKFLFM